MILKKADQADSRPYIDVLVRCKETAKSRAMEYLNETIIEELPNGDTLMGLTIVENEQLWLGTLLSLGDNIEVISPEKIRGLLIDAATKIISLYK